MVEEKQSMIVLFFARWWSWVLFSLLVIVGLLFAFVVPFTPAGVVPFCGLVIGIAWGAFIPYVEAMLEYARETGQTLEWDHKYTIAPLATFALGLFGFVGLFMFVPGAFDEIGATSFVMAAALGRAGKETWSDGRKLVAILR